jgi:Protein of unknown function (DUF2726)
MSANFPPSVHFEMLVFFGALTCILIGIQGERWRVRASYNRRWSKPKSLLPQNDMKPLLDVGRQLIAVMEADFSPCKLLSKSEARVLKAAEAAIAANGIGWRIMAQVNLGEFIKSNNSVAFSAINSKRVDLLIVTVENDPVAAIEYQGSGHFQNDAAGRDAVKKEALRKAGIAYLEITTNDRPRDLQHMIARLIERHSAAAAA